MFWEKYIDKYKLPNFYLWLGLILNSVQTLYEAPAGYTGLKSLLLELHHDLLAQTE